MQIRFPVFPLAVPALMLALGACSSMSSDKPPEVVELSTTLLDGEAETTRGVVVDEYGNVVSGTLEMDEGVQVSDLDAGLPADAVAESTVVYFGYDSTKVAQRYRAIIQRAVSHLQTSPSAWLRLEGHTDERGTRAYNLALGERRAQSVRDLAVEMGALVEQLDWVSYGEEFPAVPRQGEDAWKQNRRVELILEK